MRFLLYPEKTELFTRGRKSESEHDVCTHDGNTSLTWCSTFTFCSTSQQIRGMATEKQSKFILTDMVEAFHRQADSRFFSCQPNRFHKEHSEDYCFDEDGFCR